MDISSVSSTTNSTQSVDAQAVQKNIQDFKALASALQSGDLTTAQSAFAAWQKDMTGSQQSATGFGATDTLSQDIQSLQSALQSNDITSAQKAFSQLVQDLQSAHKSHHHHHHRSVQENDNGASTDQSSDTSSPTTSGQSNSTTLNAIA